MIKAFIFDLDGTLIDSEKLWCESIRRVVAGQGMSMTEAYSQDLVFGKAWRDILARMRADYPLLHGDDVTLELQSVGHYEALRGTLDIRIHSSIALLESLARSYPVVIVSGSSRRQIADAIAVMGIEGWLKFYCGNEDYPYGKPDPSGFLLAARQLGVQPDECLVFEDSTAGVLAAKRAGMKCIALRRHPNTTQDVSHADEVLSDLSEFNPMAYGIRLK